MKIGPYPEYLFILFLITFYSHGFFPSLIIRVIQQVDEVLISVSFSVYAQFRSEKQHGDARQRNEVMP